MGVVGVVGELGVVGTDFFELYKLEVRVQACELDTETNTAAGVRRCSFILRTLFVCSEANLVKEES